jgi:hypothetical protein
MKQEIEVGDIIIVNTFGKEFICQVVQLTRPGYHYKYIKKPMGSEIELGKIFSWNTRELDLSEKLYKPSKLMRILYDIE